jgi:hypothetical protein
VDHRKTAMMLWRIQGIDREPMEGNGMIGSGRPGTSVLPEVGGFTPRPKVSLHPHP